MKSCSLCLTPLEYSRDYMYCIFQVSYSETGEAESVFRSRVLCLPLYTLLLAADATDANYVQVGGEAALPALTHVPYESVHLQVTLIHTPMKEIIIIKVLLFQ